MVRFIAAASIALLVAVASGHAQTPAQFYAGKTVYLDIGETVGGDYDAWGRLVGRHIKDHIPGNPTVVTQNVVGAAGFTLANEMYNTLPKDGTVFGVFNRGMPFEPLLGSPGAQYDPLKMNWLGSPELDIIACAARKDAKVQTMQDLFSKELIIGGTSPGAESVTVPQLLANLLGMKIKLVKGFAGTAEVYLGVERGEVEGICPSYASLTRQGIFRNGIVQILFQVAPAPDPRIKDVPMASTLAKNDADRAAVDFFFARLGLGRPFVAPPGVPADRVASLRQAFIDTMTDPQYLDDAAKVRLTPSPVTWQHVTETIIAAYTTPKEAIQRVATVLK